MFKRILLMLLAIIMAVSVYGCSGDESTDSTAEESSTDSVAAENGASLPMLSLSVPPTSYAESGIELPDTIDSTYINNIKTKLDNAPYACAMYYVDLETGLSLTYNPDRMFAGASLVKAEYLMMIFEMIENGELSYEDLYTYTSANKRGGTTKIPQDFKYGDKLTLKQIIEYVVWHSDNTGFNMLQVYARSLWDLGPWAKNRYGTTFYYEGCNWLNARGVAECWKEIYQRYKAGDENYTWYVSLLLEANENKFIRGGLPKDAEGNAIYDVAHKYGMDINASNDAAIVFYEGRPYFLCILTDYIGINTQSFMNSISSEVFKLHEYLVSFDE
ncbi:MAG: serine hydrolase [Clostridia bacterium]|nr:serine hydrolase [Clostridia bacterium]